MKNIEITNIKVIRFYEDHKEIDIEKMNLFLIDLYNNFMSDITEPITKSLSYEILTKITNQSKEIEQFKNEILSDLNQNCPNIKSLEFINCELEGRDISVFKNLEELHLIYTVDFIEFKGIVEGLKLKKIVISGDLASGKENKNYINSLKSKGIKIETIGPVI